MSRSMAAKQSSMGHKLAYIKGLTMKTCIAANGSAYTVGWGRSEADLMRGHPTVPDGHDSLDWHR